MSYFKKLNAISLLAASSLTFFPGNSLKANEEYPSGMYGTVNLGSAQASDILVIGQGTIESDSGFSFEGSLGYDFGKRFRVDVSYTSSSPGFDGAALGIADGEYEVGSFMLNGYLDFPIEDTKWEPFIGIGIGTSEIDVEDICVAAANTDCTDSVFTLGLTGGVSYALNPSTSILGKVTYLGFGDIEITNLGQAAEIREAETVSAQIGLKFSF